jgi:hypothetical protein
MLPLRGESLILLRQSAPRLLRDVDQHLQVGANHRAGSDLGEAAGTGPLARSHLEINAQTGRSWQRNISTIASHPCQAFSDTSTAIEIR